MRLLAALALVGCAVSPIVASSPSREPDYLVPVSVAGLPLGDLPAVDAAVAIWNDALRGRVRLFVVLSPTPGSITIERVPVSSPLIPFPYDVCAWADGPGRRSIHLVERMPCDPRKVVLHELGHALGAADQETPGLMHTVSNTAQWYCVDEVAAAQVAARFEIPLPALAPFCKEPPP